MSLVEGIGENSGTFGCTLIEFGYLFLCKVESPSKKYNCIFLQGFFCLFLWQECEADVTAVDVQGNVCLL